MVKDQVYFATYFIYDQMTITLNTNNLFTANVTTDTSAISVAIFKNKSIFSFSRPYL